MGKKNLDLILILLIAALSVGWVLVPAHLPVINIILALPLVFLLPGYTLAEALFKRGSDDVKSLIVRPRAQMKSSFSRSERLVFSLGLSLIIDIIVGLVLDMLPSGLEQSSWAVALGSLTTIFALVAYWRREEGGKLLKEPDARRGRFRISLYECVLFGLALMIIASSVWFSTRSALQKQQQTGFTQFWMVPSKQANDRCAVLIGVQSFESAPVTYRVVLTANGGPLGEWPSVALEPQKEWYQSVPVTAGNSDTVTLEASLYRTNQPNSPYRTTHLTLDSGGGGKSHRLQC